MKNRNHSLVAAALATSAALTSGCSQDVKASGLSQASSGVAATTSALASSFTASPTAAPVPKQNRTLRITCRKNPKNRNLSLIQVDQGDPGVFITCINEGLPLYDKTKQEICPGLTPGRRIAAYCVGQEKVTFKSEEQSPGVTVTSFLSCPTQMPQPICPQDDSSAPSR